MTTPLVPPPSSTVGKTITAFLAGAMLGALSMVEFAPRGVAGAAAGTPIVTGATDPQLVGDLIDQGIGDDGVAVGPEGQFGVPQVGTGTTGSTTTSGSTGATGSAGSTGSTATGSAGSTGSAATGSAGSTGSATTGSQTTGGTEPSDGSGSTGSASSSGSSGPDFTTGGSGTGSSSTTTGTGGSGASCAANNGGSTDVGVTATTIEVAATVVEDGEGASLLKPATAGMVAVINKVNAAGGICGRRINLETKNDAWEADTGREFIRRFIEAGKFALVVVPSSEGLAEAIKAGMITQAGIPVVGTTGLRVDEYSDPWVFPVATATISYMRGMARYSYDKESSRTFGIVWDNKFKFGLEGATAFKDYVKTLPGASIKVDRPIDPLQATYSTEAQDFNAKCENSSTTNGCDMVALLLVPDTALKWKNANTGTNIGRGKRTHGAQTLFTDAFGIQCGGWCNGMVLWTGYNPPIPPVQDKPGVQQYVADVKNVQSSIDFRNQFVEGSYLGAQVFIEAVRQCSPQLTRACIRAHLESVDSTTDLSNTLTWRPGAHHANKFSQAFILEATGGSFNGWRYANTGWIRDPNF